MDELKELSAIEIAALISKAIEGVITPSDQQRLNLWLMKNEKNNRLFNQLTDEQYQQKALHQLGIFDTEAALARLNERIDTAASPVELKTSSIRHSIFKWAVAASLLLFLSFGSYFYFRRAEKTPTLLVKNDVAPGKNKAILTLANGKKVNLDDQGNGTIAQQPGIRISQTNKGQIVYEITNTGKNDGSVAFNTISTPNGGQYRIKLPDGTDVWLNAASSLRYPTRFEGKQRLVTLTGEGYFEVAHNSNMPFTVHSQTQDIQVLGTHFNVHNYPLEPVVTTLLEGSVKIKVNTDKNNHPYILKPGDMAINENGIKVTAATDLETITAWKEGQFVFHNTDLKTIMREVQRWYDIEVDLETLPDVQFNGVIGRDVRLSKILEMLETTSKLKFTIEGRKIMLKK
jgi:transmembrane sensor